MTTHAIPPTPNGAGPGHALATAPITPSTLEAVVVGGDLSKLTPKQRLEWYAQRCAAAGLDPRTQPFQYLSLSGKLTLYATKAATDQLIAVHGLCVEVVDRRAHSDLGVYEVQVRVTRKDGSHVDDLAAVNIRGLQGEALCNAFMKAVTKGKRRTVLSACGLGTLDESEVETIPGARIVPVDMATGELPGATPARAATTADVVRQAHQELGPEPNGDGAQQAREVEQRAQRAAEKAEAPIAPEAVDDVKQELRDAAYEVGLTMGHVGQLCQDNYGHKSIARLTPSQVLALRDRLIPILAQHLGTSQNLPAASDAVIDTTAEPVDEPELDADGQYIP